MAQHIHKGQEQNIHQRSWDLHIHLEDLVLVMRMDPYLGLGKYLLLSRDLLWLECLLQQVLVFAAFHCFLNYQLL